MQNWIIFWLQKFTRFEFWPYWVFYAPFVLQWLWYGLRSGSLLYFTAANPKMRNGGMLAYSKSLALKGLQERFLPKMQVVSHLDEVGKDWNFPLVAKPDSGERGKGVEKINSLTELENYFRSNKSQKIILQQYVDLPLEFGVFYCKTPRGSKIISLTSKRFLSVVGDGTTKLGALIRKEIRANYQKLSAKFDVERILLAGETLMLEPIGNHSRGTTFICSNELINDKMVMLFETLAAQLQDFHYGRFDVRCKDFSDLETGENLKVIEVNGANSEITHIYQPNFSLWRAYREVWAQMHLLWQISYQNHKKGACLATMNQFLKDLIDHQLRN